MPIGVIINVTAVIIGIRIYVIISNIDGTITISI